MGDTLKKGAVSLKFPAKHRKLGSKAWKQKWIELKSPEKPDEDPRIMTYDCYPFHLSGSKAEPKCIALKNISGIRLTRSRKQEYVCVIDQADKANASAINLPEGQRASKTSLHRISGSSTIMRQFKANSWSQDFTNQDETHSEPFLYVSTWNFTELHSWMTEIRNAIWPPNALHGVSDGFEVSLMDMMGSWQLSDSLRDKYGLLIVEGVTMTLFDPFTGKSHFSWNVLTFSCFDLPQTTWELDKNHIIRGFTTKFHPLGEAEVWMFCKEAESLYSRLERILFEERRLSKEPRCTMTPMMRTSKRTEEETTEQKTRTRTVAFSSTSKDHPPRRHEKLRHRDSGFVAVTASTESLKTHGVHDFPRGSKCPCKITRFMQDESCMA
ncbi:unnamed protein product [Notodromas monacha]|uniref:PH domain-containing protein n=1 Tax=Notodromas monacha TaxID=399045 RepID=A0A7R9BF69_9CRUS|nr:unnamed protein product [Notodromas monacha]CAG0914278.1 unnamed protein product [Notodromas monacha]